MKILEKIDEQLKQLSEAFMGKKEFEKKVDKIIDIVEKNDSSKMDKFWDRWDKAVGGDGDLPIDNILWRIYSSGYGGKKVWEKFKNEWKKLGFKKF